MKPRGISNGQTALQAAPSGPAAADPCVLPGCAAGYIRLTREESLKKNLSAPAQRSDIEDYIRTAGLPNQRFYEEKEAIGGDMPFEKRKACRELFSDIQAGRVSHLIVRDLDRISRDILLWLQLVDVCQKHGVTIHTLTGVLPTKSPTDKFAALVRAAAAQLEKDQVSDRVRRVKRQLARQGRHVGGPPSFGYTNQARRRADLIASGLPEEQANVQAEIEFPLAKHLYVDEAEAKVVRLVFKLYVEQRLGMRRTANELNQLGYRRRSGLLWHPDKVRNIVSNPVVAGFIPYDDAFFEVGRGPRTAKAKQTLHTGKHQAIIEEAIWRKAQEIKKANTCQHLNKGNASFANRRYALSGVLRCHCGAPMRVGSVRADKRYGYYVCSKRFYYGPKAEGGCCFPRINTDKVHEAFWSRLSEMLASPELVDQVYQAAWRIMLDRQRNGQDDPDPQRQLKKLESDLAKWYERHDQSQSSVEKEAAWKRILQLTERQKRLLDQASRRSTQQLKDSAIITRDQIARHLADLSRSIGMTNDQGKGIVQALVDHHNLRVQMKSDETLAIRLNLRPPGDTENASSEHVVPLTANATMPKDRITVWLEEERKRPWSCKGCGQAITIQRRHRSRGIPRYHHGCWLRELTKQKMAGVSAFYTGEQAAKRLGIGRTTLNRWIKNGKVPKPVKRLSTMLLFDRESIDRLADQA